MRELIIQKNDSGQRLDKFLAKAVKKLPKNLLYKYIRLKRIKRNGKRCDAADILLEGDRLSLYINDEFFEAISEQQYDFLKASPALDIVYEDENILLIDKKPGVVVHEDNRQTGDTLIDSVKHYLYRKGDYLPDNEQSFSPALCNRIDRNTGGLVIAAKNAESLRILNQKIKAREIRKYYLCVIQGVISPPTGILKGYLHKDAAVNKVIVSDKKDLQNKEILTKYHTLKTDEKHSLLEIELLTGRTHQIRAHFAHMGHPLVGDIKYGGTEKSKYHMLYSYKLYFDFKGDAGLLNYLNHRSFRVENVWFENKIL